MPAALRDLVVDRSLALRADPYRFIGERCRAAGRDVTEARVMMRRTVLMTGARAAEVFYDPARFARAGAAPEPLRATLFGKGGVQGLDGERHAARKALFVALLRPEGVERLTTIATAALDRAARDWARHDTVPLHEGLQRVLTRAVCEWAGVALPADAVALRAEQLASMYDDAMSSRHMTARHNRRDAERWLAAEIDALRAGRIGGRGEALRAVADHRDADGTPLSARVAAVELLNLLRPTVAVAVYGVFAAHALRTNPEWRDALRVRPELVDAFVQEVRRFYPFFPMVAARVREPFEWDGVRFARGRPALFDLYGTNHDPRVWNEPARFLPERFVERAAGPFELVPQGGGDVRFGHRCPGEGAAIALTRAITSWLLDGVRYDVPEQDLELDMRRLPALPRGGFRIVRVKPCRAA